jgi:hypothetical protein
MDSKFSSIPAAACVLTVGEFQIGDNGTDAKSAPSTIMARSGKAIEHPFWGNLIHDLSGMRLGKNRVAIDYCHDPKEIIGYLNHFDSASGDLMTSGALVPFKDSDRATEILHKMKQGVPYEASINFGGDGIKVEELMEGQTALVNGFALSGPACIIREWPLRGVAVCPYGQDANTESMSLSASSKTFTATVASATVPQPEKPTEEAQMSKSVEVAEVAQETTLAAVEEVKKPEEAETAEAKAVEATAIETEEEEKATAPSGEMEALKAENEALKKKMEEAGLELAQKTEAELLKAENAKLAFELAETNRKLSALSNGSTVLSSASAETTKSSSPWADAQKRK